MNRIELQDVFPPSTTSSLFTSARQIFIKNPISTLSHRKQIKNINVENDWEQRKLGELGSLKNGMNFSKEAMGHGFPFINLQNIFGNNVIDVNKLELADATEKQLLEYSLLKGDVLFVRSSVKLEGVGEAALVPETLENTTYSGL